MQDIEEYLYTERNLYTPEDRLAYLKPDFEIHTHDPFLLSDMTKTIERIKKAVDEKEVIGIYTDYDCDGIPGAVIVSDFLKVVGHTDFHVYIPDRQIDGYGLAQKGIDFLHEKGVTLIITIDLGITGHESVLYAKTLGIETIITDHHLPHETLPEAYAVVNPKKAEDEYPFKELCGTGVVYKVICAFLENYRDEYSVVVGFEKWLLDMVGMATLADMVPLVGENRVFSYYGLVVLRKTKRKGLKKLFSLNFMKEATLSEEDITHTIVPRINASSRMGSAYVAYRMLVTDDLAEAESCAKELESLNRKRKAHVAAITKEVHKMDVAVFADEIIVVGDPKWRPGVLGLVASKLVDEYKKPVFVWGGSDEEDVDILKGSCRAPEGHNLVDLMIRAKDIFVHFGGHTGAGGFSIHKKDIFDFKKRVLREYNEYVKEQKKDTPVSVVFEKSYLVDGVDEKLFMTINQFAPFGLSNEKPILKLEGVTLESWKLFGKGEEHLEMIYNINGKLMKGISFFKTDASFGRTLSVGDTYTIFVYLEMSYFLRKELRLRIIDVI